jgi:DnaJ-class molecular chaperone
MSSKYQQIEILLGTIKCTECSGAGRTQYAASSPIVRCITCNGSGFAKGSKRGIGMIVDALCDIKRQGKPT